MLSINRLLAAAALLALAPLLSHCGDDGGGGDDDDDMMVGDDDDDMMVGDDDDDDDPVLVSVAVDPATLDLVPEETATVTVTGTYDDESTEDVTAMATFASSDPDVATIDETGTVTGVAAGDATITATVREVSGDAAVTVSEVSRDDVVFDDEFGPGVEFSEFGGSNNDLTIDTTEFFAGTASLRIPVPEGGYTGGSFIVETPRDVSDFDALSFAIKGDTARTMDAVGIGNRSMDRFSPLNTEFGDPNRIAVTTDWQEFLIPIPDPARFDEAIGLFHFAENDGDGTGVIYLDEVRFVALTGDEVSNPRPEMATEPRTISEGNTFTANGAAVVWDIDGSDVRFAPTGPAFFTYLSSNTAAVDDTDDDGVLEAIAPGMAEVTATLDGTAVTGTMSVTVVEFLGPTMPAPTPPPRDAADVISVFSDAYDDIMVTSFLEFPGGPTQTIETVDGNETLKYANAVFIGIRIPNTDATDMTHFHMDLWIEDPDPTEAKVKLVDFGSTTTEGELLFNPAGDPRAPAITDGEWLSFDLELDSFSAAGGVDVGDLQSRENLAQIILVASVGGAATTFWVDNLYFYAE